MKRPILGREGRSILLRTLALFVVLEGLLAVAIIWWPTFADNIGSLRKLSAPLPMLGEMLDSLEQFGVAGYVIGQHFFKGCNTVGILAVILNGMGAIAGEAHRGTLELWLSRPVPRWRLVTERYVLGMLAWSVPVFLSSATVPWLLATVGETMPMSDLMVASLHECLFLGVIYSVTFLWSAMSSEPLVIAFAMFLGTTAQFGIYFVKTITHYSMFRFVDIERFLALSADAGPDYRVWVGLFAVSLACFLGSIAAVRRRVP